MKNIPPAIVIATSDSSCQIFICTEWVIVCECKTFLDAITNLIGVYYVFDMAYSKRDHPVLLFLQRFTLCIQDGQLIPPVLIRTMSLLDNN